MVVGGGETKFGAELPDSFGFERSNRVGLFLATAVNLGRALACRGDSHGAVAVPVISCRRTSQQRVQISRYDPQCSVLLTLANHGE
jgi:hypothetical protein